MGIIKGFFKLLFLPFVIIWRLVFGLFKLIFLTEVLLTLLFLLALAAGAFYLLKGDHEAVSRILNMVSIRK